MSGVVYRPPFGHVCRPGCVESPADPDGPLAGKTLVSPPWPPDYPRGTVWECDCGTRWISRGLVARNCHGGTLGGGFTMDRLEWEREGRFARWRRLRRERADSERGVR